MVDYIGNVGNEVGQMITAANMNHPHPFLPLIAMIVARNRHNPYANALVNE